LTVACGAGTLRLTVAIHRRIRVPGDPGDRITVIGIAWNIVLLVMKVVLGIFTGSAGLVADGIHSASDIATDLAVLGGMHIGRREADEEHPYGHGRFETLAGGTVAGVLVLVGGFIAWEGIVALYRGEHSFPGGVVVAAAVASILVKEWMYRRTARVAKALDSAALQANAWHHRSDALSSVAVLAGGIGGLVGWGYADHVAGLVVGLMVVGAGAKTLAGVLHELTEGGLSGDDVDLLRRTISTVGGVRGSHRLRTRRVGRETFVDVHVLVDPSLSIVEAHQVSSDVETAIHRAWSRPVNVTVHVEPEEGRFSDA
jgi:cation diffusion facilitator family transporter